LVWVGLVIGFGGVAVLVSPQLNLEKSSFPAVLAVLAASLLWSVGSILMKRNPVNSALMPSVGLQMLSAGSVFLLIAAITGDFSLAEASFSGYAALIYLIFIGSILAYSAFFYMIKFIPMAKAGTYAYINPVVAIVLGSLILNETLTAQKIMAAGVIIFGVVLVQRSKVSTKTALMAEEEVPAKRSLNWNIFPQKRKEE
ncbi:MAG: EamA family transporter, partial [Dethiobacter sp.]|nr:EamA family transporter [Dethiobacter sp.]